MPPQPYLSIILTGRNDNFGGDFNQRFLAALLHNHRHLRALGVSHEFVIVEWAPLPGRPYLVDLVTAACGATLADDQLVSYVVDPRYHEAVSQNDRIAFQEFLAKNVGVRRCHGRFVLTTNTDIFLGRLMMETLSREDLDLGVLYRTARTDLRKDLPLDRIDWEMLEDTRNTEIVHRIKPPHFTNASGDFLLLDRGSYHQLRSFNEVYRVAKISIDSNFCVKAHAAGLALVDLQCPIYHVGLGTYYGQNARYRSRPDLAPWGDIRWNHTVIYHNPDDWGLGAAPLRQVAHGVHYLDFDWRAVPRLLDLKRLHLPVTRPTPRP